MPLGTRDVFANGTLQILYGGTRKKLNLSRPWQRSIGETAEASKTTCPFETKPQVELDRVELEGETWLVLDNIMTPYEFHRLVIPEKC